MKLFIVSLLAIWAQAFGQNLQFKFTNATLEMMTPEEVEAYENDPANKPSLLEAMPKKGTPQPATAGTLYLQTARQIIGGSRVVQTQFPWQVYLIADKGWLCGGSLIASNWVLTGAQCVEGGKSFVVTVGGVDRLNVETGEKTQTASKAIKHPRFKKGKFVFDIAVIQVPAGFELNTYVNVIRLPTPAQAKLTFEGSNVTASGYGLTEDGIIPSASSYMHHVSLIVIKNSQCAKYFGRRVVISSTICTANYTSRAICGGDTGGPLMLKESDGRYTQIGIVSFGSWYSCANFPNGYTRLASFVGWIAKKTGIVSSG